MIQKIDKRRVDRFLCNQMIIVQDKNDLFGFAELVDQVRDHSFKLARTPGEIKLLARYLQ
jgi:hypothetical protein